SDIEDGASNDYDPWQHFNEKMFSFNHDVFDRRLLKPIAKGWNKALPDVGKRGLDRAFDNLGMPRRLVNNLLQGRFRGAGREVARFGVNTTIGVVGFLDVAKAQLHIDSSDADTGQTLGVYGWGPGPYLVLPSLQPLTVRDGIGHGVGSEWPGSPATRSSCVRPAARDRAARRARRRRGAHLHGPPARLRHLGTRSAAARPALCPA